MAKNTGKEYEKFVESIYQTLTKDERFTTVERDVNLEGKDGHRQIDVLLRSEVAGMDFLTIIECKDHRNKRLDVSFVDKFESVLNDVNANKGVLVSRYGFSKTAIRKAKRVGITLSHASDAKTVVNELSTEIPIKVNLLTISGKVDFNLDVKVPEATGSISDSVKEMSIFDILYERLKKVSPKNPPSQSELQKVVNNELNLPHPVKDHDGKHVFDITKIVFELKFSNKFYYGFIEDLPDLTSLYQYDSHSSVFVVRADDFPKLYKALPKMERYENENSIPPNYKLTFNLIDFRFSSLTKEPIENTPEQIVRIKH